MWTETVLLNVKMGVFESKKTVRVCFLRLLLWRYKNDGVIVHLQKRAQKKLFQSFLRLDIPNIKNWRFKPVFEYLCKKGFYPSSARRFFIFFFFSGNEGSAGIFFMKIHVETVHLVTSSQKCDHKEGLGLLVVISKTAAFGTFLIICMQNAFFCIHS